MKRYLKTIAFAAALSFVAALAPHVASAEVNESAARAKLKMREIKCQSKEKVCEIKCKKDDACKTKCAEEAKTCNAPKK